MLVLLALADALVQSPAARPQVQAQATVRIERGVQAGEGQWRHHPLGQRREIRRKDSQSEFTMFDCVESPPISDGNAPGDLFPFAKFRKRKEIDQHKIDEVVSWKSASSVGARGSSRPRASESDLGGPAASSIPSAFRAASRTRCMDGGRLSGSLSIGIKR